MNWVSSGPMKVYHSADILVLGDDTGIADTALYGPGSMASTYVRFRRDEAHLAQFYGKYLFRVSMLGCNGWIKIFILKSNKLLALNILEVLNNKLRTIKIM